MTQVMTPSEMTRDQIDKAVAGFRAMLEKHAGNFESDPVQIVLGQSEFLEEIFQNFRRCVEDVSQIIWREVEVDYDLTPKQVLKAIGRKQSVNAQVLATMPRLGKGKVKRKVGFFRPGRLLSYKEADRAYKIHGLVSDPYALATVNATDPAFADESPNGCQWGLEGNEGSFLTFCEGWWVGRDVNVDRADGYWDDYWSFGGVLNSLDSGS